MRDFQVSGRSVFWWMERSGILQNKAGRKVVRGLVAEGTMSSPMVVVKTPTVNHPASGLQPEEQFPVEQLVTELAVELLHIAILPGTALGNEQSGDASLDQATCDTEKARHCRRAQGELSVFRSWAVGCIEHAGGFTRGSRHALQSPPTSSGPMSGPRSGNCLGCLAVSGTTRRYQSRS